MKHLYISALSIILCCGLASASPKQYSVKERFQKVIPAKAVLKAPANRASAYQAPTVTEFTDVSDDSFTANWTGASSADGYSGLVYTCHEATMNETFSVLEEGFAGITVGSVIEPVWEENVYVKLDGATVLPDWSVYGYACYVRSMVGGIIYSPYMYLCNNDGKFSVTVNVCGHIGDVISVTSCGATEIERTDSLKNEGENSFTFTFDNGCQDTYLRMYNTGGDLEAEDALYFFFDDVIVTQDLKKGDKAYQCVNVREDIDGGNTSATFSGFKEYLYGAKKIYYSMLAAYRYYEDPDDEWNFEQYYSDYTPIVEVEGYSGVENVSKDLKATFNPDETVAIYTTTGSLVRRCKAADLRTQDIQHNIYIVKGKNATKKMIL